MIGDTHGVLLCHLQACHELLQLSKRKGITIDPSVHAFVLESYLYASAVGTTFVYDGRPATLTFGPDYDSLQSLCHNSKGYGFMLGYAARLFQLLPCLGQTVGHWIRPSGSLDAMSIEEAFIFFERQLCDWVPSYNQEFPKANLFNVADDMPGTQSILERWHHEAQVVAEIYRQAILALLYTGRHGRRAPDAALFSLVDPLIEEFLRLRATLPQESPVWCLMLWPTVMIGSCIRRPEHRLMIEDKDCCMPTVLKAFNVLQQIWDDERDAVFGVLGLSMICASQQITLCPI